MTLVWIGAHEVMKLLDVRSASAAECWAESIVDRAGRGLIPAQAQSLYLSGIEQPNSPAPIPREVWRAYNLEQNWVTGDFKAKGNPFAKKPLWFEAFGVEFDRSKIEALVPAGGQLTFQSSPPITRESGSDGMPSPPPASPTIDLPKGRPGRKPNQDDWKRFAAAFAVVASKEDIDPGASAADIYKQIADYANNEQDTPIMSEETVRDAITLAQAWKGGIRVN